MTTTMQRIAGPANMNTYRMPIPSDSLPILGDPSGRHLIRRG